MDNVYNFYTSIKNKINGVPNPENTAFCYFPFFEILISSDGKYKPCSKHHDYITHEGKIMDVKSHSIMEAWNSDYLQNMRQMMLNEQRHPGCSECWREQDNGVIPMRYDSFQYSIPRSQVKSLKYPIKIEINASNVCNLKCRICTSFASTKWAAEEKSLYGRAEEKHLNLTTENLPQLYELIPTMRELAFFGGEPFLSEENIELLRYCVSTGHAKHIQILVNTNTTVYTDEIASLLKKFRKVYLNFSIDDIGKRFEYQRKGAIWEEVVLNMKKFIAHGGYSRYNKIECKICCTVTNMNIFYFPEYFEYMNTQFPGLPVFWNLLYNPPEFSVQILPKDVKDVIRHRLLTQLKQSYAIDKLRTKTIDTLITYLDYDEQSDFSSFFKLVERHDKYRKEQFSEVFPELWELIAKYQHKEEEVIALA